jgi:uncharacterized protein YceK
VTDLPSPTPNNNTIVLLLGVGCGSVMSATGLMVKYNKEVKGWLDEMIWATRQLLLTYSN